MWFFPLQKGTVLDAGGSQASFGMQAFTLTKRSFVNMSRDFGYYWLRLIIYIVVTVCIGSIYLNVGTKYSSILVTKEHQIFLQLTVYTYIWLAILNCKYCLTFHVWWSDKKNSENMNSGTGRMRIFHLWLRHVHVHRRVPVFRGRHEGLYSENHQRSA
jgi:hypothetical protein